MKAGAIPYFVKNGVIRMLFMIPSDARYGGSDPQIAKGQLEDGEDKFESAIREAEEELGLKRINILQDTLESQTFFVSGLKNAYEMYVVCFKVAAHDDFDAPHYETKATVWLTLDEFVLRGRSIHVDIVSHFCESIRLKEIQNE